jgi:hypothetical protein
MQLLIVSKSRGEGAMPTDPLYSYWACRIPTELQKPRVVNAVVLTRAETMVQVKWVMRHIIIIIIIGLMGKPAVAMEAISSSFDEMIRVGQGHVQGHVQGLW